MLLDNSLAVNIENPADGQYFISGWINCPVGSRALLRFLTTGTAEHPVEGLHWGSTGGWYKYLPATGKFDRFEVWASFDREVHGTPEIRIERWFGDGEIELLLDQDNWSPKILFWGGDSAYDALLGRSRGLFERFPLSSCLLTAAEPKFEVESYWGRMARESQNKSLEFKADTEKLALELLGQSNFDILVLDLELLCVPIVDLQGTRVELNRYTKALGVEFLKTELINPGSQEHFEILRHSLKTILTVIRPKPVVFQSRGNSQLGFNYEHRSIAEALKTEFSVDGESDFTFLDIPFDEDKDSEIGALKEIDFGRIFSSSLVTLDAYMAQREKASTIVLLSSPIHIEQLDKQNFRYLPSEFTVEIDILVPQKYRERNLLLTFDIEGLDGKPLVDNLSKFSIYRSTMHGINYFKYFPSVQGSATVEFEVRLPENVRCTAIGVTEIRSRGDVFVTRFEIHSDVNLERSLATEFD